MAAPACSNAERGRASIRAVVPARGLRWCAPAAATVAVVLAVVGGARWPAYRHRSQFLSELGQRGAPDGAAVSAGFVAIGALLAGSAVHGEGRFRHRPPARAGVLAVTLGFAVSYAAAGAARCDPGCPERGRISTSQAVHNAAGAAGYLAAAGGMGIAGWALRRSPHRGVAGAGLVGAPVAAVLSALMASESNAADRGLLQRIVEVVVFGWMIAAVRRPGSEATPPPLRSAS